MNVEAMFYTELPENAVQCHLCGRRCWISEGSKGFCGVKLNEKGKLYSLVHSIVCSAHVDPISKIPLLHFHPGSFVMSVATVGCNFRCQFCDNWVLSQAKEITGSPLPPEKIVESAKDNYEGISYAYTEPTVFFEYAYDIANRSHDHGLFNTFVTNGYMTPEAVKTIAPFLDAVTVNFKGGGNPKFYKNYLSVPSVEPIYDCLLEMKKHEIHIEITNLVIPKLADSKESVLDLAIWVRDNLGKKTPFHLLKFFPNFQLSDLLPTPISTLEQSYHSAKSAGLNYVYICNVPGHPYENTYCPNCHALLIKRFSYVIVLWRLTKDYHCPQCDESIYIKGIRHRSNNLTHPAS